MTRIVIKAGDTVMSDEKLDLKFPNKFELADRPIDKPKPPATGNKTPVDVDDAPPAKDEDADADEDNDTPDEDEDTDQDEDGEVTFKAVNRGRGRWDVAKFIDDEETDEVANEDGFLKQDEAKAMADKLNEED